MFFYCSCTFQKGSKVLNVSAQKTPNKLCLTNTFKFLRNWKKTPTCCNVRAEFWIILIEMVSSVLIHSYSEYESLFFQRYNGKKTSKKTPTKQFKIYEQEFKHRLFQNNKNSHTKHFVHSECNCSNSVFVLMETACEWT